MVHLGEDPFISLRQLGKLYIVPADTLLTRLIHVHENETGCVPYLVGKIPARLYLLVGIAHIVARCVAGNQRETQCVSAVLVNDLQRVNTVAERFAHLASLLVADKSVNQNRVERYIAHVLQSGKYHADNPEENDVIAGYQNICRVEIIKLRRMIRPSQRGERPQRR